MSADAPIRIEQPKPLESGARPRRARRIDGSRKPLARDKSDEPFVPRIRLRGFEKVKPANESARVTAATAEAPRPTDAPATEATTLAETVEIAAIKAGISDEGAKKIAEAAEVIESATKTEGALSRSATVYAIDRGGDSNANIPVNEQFRVVGAMKKNFEYKAELSRLIDAEGKGGVSTRQRLKQLEKQAARNCYYREAQRQMIASKGELAAAVTENPVFKDVIKREAERAEQNGVLPDMDEIRTRALADLLAAEAVKKDKSMWGNLLKILALLGFAGAVTIGGELKGVAAPQG